MSNPIESEPISWLASEGRRYLTGEASEAERQHLPVERRSLIEEQLAFQRRARRRFPRVADWLWTDRSLSQASDWWTAHFKAALFPSEVGILDACCGAGADLVAFARRCQAIGVDADPTLVALAKANVQRHQCQAELRWQTIDESFRLEGPAELWLHIDPDRRADTRRSIVGEEFSPPLSLIWKLAEQASGAMLKLAPKTLLPPGFDDAAFSNSCLRLWCGSLGECRQQLWLTGGLREQTSSRFNVCAEERLAVLIRPGTDDAPEGSFEVFAGRSIANLNMETGTPDLAPVGTGSLPAFVYDLDATLYAADLQSHWAETQQLQPLTDIHGYYAADKPIETEWAQGFEVLDVVPWDDRRVRKALRGLKAGCVEVKNRLVKLDANFFQRRYSRDVGDPLTLLVTRLGERTRCILARRL